MADKRLIYNENGTNAEIPNSGSNKAAYFDDISNTLVVQGLIINRVTSSISNSNGILGTDGTGKLTIIPTASATTGQYLQSNGTSWAFRTATGEANGNYLPNSDLSGSLAAPTVLSIQNVVSGVLSARNGGTGVSTFTSGGILVKDSGSAIKFIRPDAGASVLRPDGSGSWYSGGSVGTASYNIQAQQFTSPGSWTKPPKHRNVKVILMGGGGGGGGGYLNPASSSPTGYGYAGGAAGFSVYDFYESGDLTADITVGLGGSGGICYNSSIRATGSDGGDTIFSSSNFYYFCTGGNGATTTAAGTNGSGNMSQRSGAGGRGGGGGGSGIAGSSGGSLLLINSSVATGGSGGAANTAGGVGGNISTAFGVTGYYAMIGGGGGGGGSIGFIGARGGNGGNGIYGSGGGGSGNTGTSVSPITRGGNGGNGYAIIISW